MTDKVHYVPPPKVRAATRENVYLTCENPAICSRDAFEFTDNWDEVTCKMCLKMRADYEELTR